jgi:hypothetical protein
MNGPNIGLPSNLLTWQNGPAVSWSRGKAAPISGFSGNEKWGKHWFRAKPLKLGPESPGNLIAPSLAICLWISGWRERVIHGKLVAPSTVS